MPYKVSKSLFIIKSSQGIFRNPAWQKQRKIEKSMQAVHLQIVRRGVSPGDQSRKGREPVGRCVYEPGRVLSVRGRKELKIHSYFPGGAIKFAFKSPRCTQTLYALEESLRARLPITRAFGCPLSFCIIAFFLRWVAENELTGGNCRLRDRWDFLFRGH